MPNLEILDRRIRELSEYRFKDFEAGLLQQKAQFDRAAKFEERRENARRELLQSSGINVSNLDRVRANELRSQTQELREFIDEFKPAAVTRAGRGAADAKEAAVWSATFAEGGHLVLPPFVSSIFVADKAVVANDPGESGSGAINSGWIFPEDPSKIRIMKSHHIGAW